MTRPLALAILGITSCATSRTAPSEGIRMNWSLTSSAFTEGGEIPAQHTCEGPDLSPPLTWSEPPTGTQSIALVVDDPDAPGRTWVHWVLWGVPRSVRGLPQDVARVQHLPDGSRQGRNDFGRLGYGGACPPPGPAHRYYFRLYALDTGLDLAAGATRSDLDRAMQGHIVGQTALMGRYARRVR